jgi:hypothetical protein
LKLVEKVRQGSKVLRKYDQAQTPYQRVMAAESVSEITKQDLKKQYEQLDPVSLLANIHRLQDQLWPWAYLELESSASRMPNFSLPNCLIKDLTL